MKRARRGAPEKIADIGDGDEKQKQPGVIVKVWQMAREQDAHRIDDRRFVGTRLRVRKAEANRAKAYKSGDCQESRQQPERWPAELRRDHERKSAPPEIECIRSES